MTGHFKQLGEIAEFVNGLAFKPEDWQMTGRKIIRIQNLTDSAKPFNCTTKHVADKFLVRKDDVLFSWSATLGVFVWTRDETAVLNQHIFKVIPNETIVYKWYLKYVLEDAIQKMGQHLHGATMQHINRGEFLSTPVFVPSLAEQKRIAAILEEADALLRKRREAVAKLDTLLQSVFLEMFGDPFTNSKGWKIARLGELGNLDRGKSKHRPRNAPSIRNTARSSPISIHC